MDLVRNRAYDGENFGVYVEYLNGVKHHLTKELFAFASDPSRHDLGARSLHDSYIEVLCFARDRDGHLFHGELVLVGPERDRRFRLDFDGIKNFDVHQVTGDMYRDLITFEIVVDEIDPPELEVMMTFRAQFASEPGHLEVSCRQMSVREEPVAGVELIAARS